LTRIGELSGRKTKSAAGKQEESNTRRRRGVYAQ
jgi:hypothetical protein